MNNEGEPIFITASKVCSYPPCTLKCASCGGDFEADVVLEDVGGCGHDTEWGYWVGMSWSDPRSGAPTSSYFCWGCASLFMRGDYRGASQDYDVDLEEFAAAVRRVARRLKHMALNPQESAYPAVAIDLLDYNLEGVRKLEAAYPVNHKTFFEECRVDLFV